jgi:hypothetical protein
MLVAQWYETLKESEENYSENILHYQRKLQENKIYDFNVYYLIANSSTSLEDNFKVPF